MRLWFSPSFRQVTVLAALVWTGAARAQLMEPTCRAPSWRGRGSFTAVEPLDLAGEAPGDAPAAATAIPTPTPVPSAPAIPTATAKPVADTAEDDDTDSEPEVQGESVELQSAKEVEARALAGDEALRLLRARAFAQPGVGSPLASRIHDALDGDGAGARADAREAQEIQEEIERFATFDIESAASHYDIPVELNEQVGQYIRLFQGPLRDHFVLWLSRATRYVPRMREILVAKGLPADTVYLALIESGFNALAYSRARAAGH